MAKDPAIRAHEEWIGLCQPTGLVVSPVALVGAGAFVDKNVKAEQDALRRLVDAAVEVDRRAGRDAVPRVESFSDFVTQVLGWRESDLSAPSEGDVERFHVVLEDYGETLRATYVVKDKDGSPLLLVKVLPTGTDVDDEKNYRERMWQASAQARFERILWETHSKGHNNGAGVPIGVLWNGLSLRLVYVPRGETSGHITFPLGAMCEVANRPMLSGLMMLLSPERLWTLPTKSRLPAILQESRKYQNQVSTELAEQVLAALSELLKGFQAADEYAKGSLLVDLLSTDDGGDDAGGEHVYGGLLSVLLRLVFVLFAEDRSLLPDDDTYRQGYSVTRLFERLREDAALYPDTMDQRFGAWGQLLSLFRLIHDGGSYRTAQGVLVRIPRREGQLFNPASYPFLEGRRAHRGGAGRQADGTVAPARIPRISDGVVYRVLNLLLLLDGQRLSYRTLDVEQIGSVYEGLMGFKLDRFAGRTIAVKPHHVYADVEALLALKAGERAKWLKDAAGCDLAAKAAAALKEAATVDDVVAALGSKVSPRTPGVLPAGSLFLQPTDERRRSGSHYTPRALTEPIVRTALRPIFERLAEEAKDKKKGPSPDEILDLKVCDPAMGSGAFLVEACRQIAERLVEAWGKHGEYPDMPPDEAPLLHAMRKVATRCLYGVDKNRFAVELAKLSLWLATLAKDHPFTFVDHALRCGDSLVGLTKSQISDFTWEERGQRNIASQWIDDALKIAEIARQTIARLGDTPSNDEKKRLLREAEDEIGQVRMIGDACVAAFFSSTKPKEQKAERERLLDVVLQWQTKDRSFERLVAAQAQLAAGEYGVRPFHWQIEFPEVFARSNPGFDVFAGNPPFLGGKRISAVIGDEFKGWLAGAHPEASANTDLVAHFFRRAFALLRVGGAAGLVATKTIAQGDTRRGGLKWICENGGIIYTARRRFPWPGAAAVIVSVVHFARNQVRVPFELDGKGVDTITAYLFYRGGSADPHELHQNANIAFIGCDIKGQGFLFADGDEETSPLAMKDALLAREPRAASIVKRYIGGEDVNSDPLHLSERFAIDFGEMDESQARGLPETFKIVEARVRPDRTSRSADIAAWPFWRYWRPRPELRRATAGLTRVIAIARVSQTGAFVLLPTDAVLNEKVVVFARDDFKMLGVLQSRVHEIWARFFSATLKDDLQYAPSDCFETFPFPPGWEANAKVGDVGKRYYDFRAALMVKNNQGLTKTYNRFHDPDHDGTGVEGRDPADVVKDIEELRRLHDEMDRAVLHAYGWTDIQPKCEFLLDYEEDDDEDEGGKRRKKKPWRYRWPDDVRDEVLARLLELNRKRAEEERLLADEAKGAASTNSTFALEAPTKKTGRRKKAST